MTVVDDISDAPRARSRGKKPAVATANGKPKGKGRAKPGPKSTQEPVEYEVIDEEQDDQIEILDAMDVDERVRPETPPNKRHRRGGDSKQNVRDAGASTMEEKLQKVSFSI